MSTCTHPTPTIYGPTYPTLNELRGIRYADAGGDGAGAGGDGAGGDGGDGSGDDGDGDEKLGAAGVQALERTKADLKAKKAALKEFSDLGLSAADLKALVDAKNAGDTPDEAAIEKRLRTQIESEQREKSAVAFRASAVREHAATMGFLSPKDALALLDNKALTDIEVEDDGTVDADDVAKALQKLAADKPYLLKNPDDETPDWRSAGIGSAGSGKKPDVQPGRARLERAYANTSRKK